MYVGGLRARQNTVDRCLTDPGDGDLPVLEQCDTAVNKGLNLHWDFKQVGGFLYPHISIIIISHHDESLDTFLAKQFASE